jgi:dTDP-4-amino-4,6-dideoxygalactose transaminase
MARIVSDVDSSRPDFIPWWRTEVTGGDVDLITSALFREQVSMGAVTAQLEREIAEALDIPYVVATTSGSVALTMAMMALDIGPGDEVIVPDRTFIATAHGAHLLGAKIVLADCLPDSPNIDPGQLEALVNSRTRAIIPVHLNGRFCRMDEILAIASKYGIPVVEDAAQAVFSRAPGGFMGGFGQIGCFSFGMTKLISTGQGGAVLTRDRAIYENLRALRNHGVRDVVTHDYLQSGHNFKFTDMQAALGLGQARRWAAKVNHCNAVYTAYSQGLAGQSKVTLVPVNIADGECSLWAEIVTDERDALADFLARRGIQTRHFLPCLHTAPHLATARQMPNSDRFGERGLILPSGPSQPLQNVQRTIEAVRDWVASNSGQAGAG